MKKSETKSNASAYPTIISKTKHATKSNDAKCTLKALVYVLSTTNDKTALEARKERLHVMEKELDLQMQHYREKLQMIEKEMESCEQMLEKNIERSFKY